LLLLTATELAGLLPLEYGELCFRDVVIALRDDADPDYTDREFFMNKSHPAYMPLHYEQASGTFAIERIPKRKGALELNVGGVEYAWGLQAQHTIIS
jgi:hypothetical protein